MDNTFDLIATVERIMDAKAQTGYRGLPPAQAGAGHWGAPRLRCQPPHKSRGYDLGNVRRFLLNVVWPRLELPIALILVHFAISLLALLSLAAIKWVVRIAGIEQEIIPGSNTTVSDWILYLEVVASSVIIVFGAVEALAVLVLGIILDCVKRAREISNAWRS